MAPNVYIFSGLGADERAFQKLDFSGFSVTFIKWFIPNERETIENYSTRLLEQIPTQRPILIGLSFGGLVAIEVTKQIDTEKVILISSAKTRNEIPFYYRWAGKLGFHKLLPTQLLKKSNLITNWFFGTTSTFDIQLLKNILIDTDATFLKWAIDKVVNWKNQTRLKNLIHVHGTSDRILPFRFINCDYEIKNGGHLMTLTQADELTEIIREILRMKK